MFHIPVNLLARLPSFKTIQDRGLDKDNSLFICVEFDGKLRRSFAPDNSRSLYQKHRIVHIYH